jgi:hypothetical protein
MSKKRLRAAKLFNTRSRFYHFARSNECIFSLSGAIHHSIVSSQAWGVRWFARKAPLHRRDEIHKLVTIIVKTFERPHALHRLLYSIRALYGDIKVIVASDSKNPENLPGVRYIHLPFNSGVSRGRSAALHEVTTPYFVSLDDDFILWKGSDLGLMLKGMEAFKEIDVMGGWLINLPFGVKSGPGGIIHLPGTCETGTLSQNYVGPYARHGKVPQFYMAKTDRIRDIGWDHRIKVLDHSMFFGRLYNKRTVVFNKEVSVLHARTPFDSHYLSYRNDLESDKKLSEKDFIVMRTA